MTTSLRMTNRLLSKLKSIVSHENHKRTQQGVPNVLLPDLYNRYMVYANDKYTYSNVHVLSISPPYHFHKVNIFSNIIVLDLSTTFQTYDLVSYDITYDCDYMPLYCSRELKGNKMKMKNENKK